MRFACDCNTKNFNYVRRVKPRVDGSYLPDNWSDRKPARYNFKKKSFRMDRACNRSRKGGERVCDNAWAEPPIVMNNLNGYKLCGKRGG